MDNVLKFEGHNLTLAIIKFYRNFYTALIQISLKRLVHQYKIEFGYPLGVTYAIIRGARCIHL